MQVVGIIWCYNRQKRPDTLCFWTSSLVLFWRVIANVLVCLRRCIDFSGGGILIPGSFDYCVATSLSEAVGLLERYGDEAKILAGGHSLIPLLRFRLAAPAILIDINPVHELEYIHETDGFLHIGA